ncbi:hypothetical protein BDR07DRAFT_1489780 [Suillus spraguei]|nr:hypothetical protein BDR07DRAFT_1489780 [Suillus spraguei]
MLNHAEANKEIGRQECNLTKHMKINFLQLSMAEWTCAGQFVDLFSHADVAQQAFSSECSSTLHLAIPALKHSTKPAVAMKVDKYYEKMMKLPAYIMAMLLDPVGKMVYFKWHWQEDLHDEVLTTAEKVFKARYLELNEEGTSLLLLQPASKKKDDLSVNPTLASIGNPLRPWRAEVMSYIETIEATLPAGMTIIQWWGINALRYPVWASLAQDYLSTMSSSIKWVQILWNYNVIQGHARDHHPAPQENQDPNTHSQ